MSVLSDTHLRATNIYVKPLSGWTETERAAIQRALKMHLGPEYIKYRPGGGGASVAYLEGCKSVELANETFGFNGWSSRYSLSVALYPARDSSMYHVFR